MTAGPVHRGPRVVLVGAPGAGKTSVGTELARRLAVPHLDTDGLVEARAGQEISEIFVVDGEPAFRALERQAVLDALAVDGAVVSTGGGAVLDDEVRAAMAGLPVVWLEVSLADAAPRVGIDAPRPLLAFQPRAAWRELLARREPLYAQVSRHRVDTGGQDIAGVADQVGEVLGWER